MARVAVIGASGMLGHVASRDLARDHAVVAALRRAPEPGSKLAEALAGAEVVSGLDVRAPGAVAALIARVRPDVVLNCVGLIKQRPEAADTALAIELNALFPHRLAAACDAHGAKLIQVSTDCVFSGRRGLYTEDDQPDPVDGYGLSKWLGEVRAAPHLTIRTSIIGPQLEGTEGLVGWFLSQQGRAINGYTRAVFSGLTTRALAAVLGSIIADHPELTGLTHVAAAPISKFDLLRGLATRIGWRGTITPVDAPAIDRSLDGSRFRHATGIAIPDWDSMLDALAADLGGAGGRSGSAAD